MTKPKLRAVEAGETAKVAPPVSLVAAVDRDRRTLLVRSRLEVARTIDAGVPAHALARLISELDRIDSEIRRLDAAEADDHDRDETEDATFDATAI